jgi:hypothetical protein
VEDSTSASSGLNTKQRKESKCVCGFAHRYAKCYYLNESLRPVNWKANPDIIKAIEERLLKDDKLRRQIEKVKKHVAESQQVSDTEQPSAACAVTD